MTSTASSSDAGDGIERFPSYSPQYPFTLYQHKIVFDPPLDYDVSKYKFLVEFAEYSPSIFNGKVLFMTRAIREKNRIGCSYYYDQKSGKKTLITWRCTYIGKVHKLNQFYGLFNSLIFTPGVQMNIFNLENKTTNTCVYKYDKRFDTFSITPLHRYYKTVIQFARLPGFQNEILYCSVFAESSSNIQKRYKFFPDPAYCYNVGKRLKQIFVHMKDQERAKEEAESLLIGKKIITGYSGKIYKIGHIEFGASPKGEFIERHTGQKISFLDYYKSKYGIEIPEHDQSDIMLIAFPTASEDISMNGKTGNIYLVPSLCYCFKIWNYEDRTFV